MDIHRVKRQHKNFKVGLLHMRLFLDVCNSTSCGLTLQVQSATMNFPRGLTGHRWTYGIWMQIFGSGAWDDVS